MPEDFSFKWTLLDEVSRSATAIQRALEKAEGAMKHAQGAARGGSSSWAMMGLRMGAVVGIASELTRGLLRVGEGAIHLGVSGAKYAIEAASFRENSLIGLEAIMGSRQAAVQALDQWSALSEHTPFDNRKLQEWGKQLTIAGESLGNTVTILKGVADIGTVMGNTADEQERFASGMVQAISNIKQMGSVSEKQLRTFREMGVSPQKIMANMAGRLTAGNVPALKKLMESGQDISHEAVLAILQTVQDTYGKLGGVGKKGSETLSGLFTKLDFDDLFKGLENSKGFNAMKDVLRNIKELLDPRSASGKAIHDAMMDLSTALGSALAPLTGPEGRKNMLAFFDAIRSGVESVMPAIKLLGQSVAFVAKWGLFKPLQAVGVAQDIYGIATGKIQKGQESATTREFLGAAFGPPPATQGVPSMLARPSLNVTNTIHVHGNADTDDLLLKIDTTTQDALNAYFDRMGLMAGSQ